MALDALSHTITKRLPLTLVPCRFSSSFRVFKYLFRTRHASIYLLHDPTLPAELEDLAIKYKDMR